MKDVNCASQCYSCNGQLCTETIIDTCGSNDGICQVYKIKSKFNKFIYFKFFDFFSFQKKITTYTAGVSVYSKQCVSQCNDQRVIQFGPTTIS